MKTVAVVLSSIVVGLTLAGAAPATPMPDVGAQKAPEGRVTPNERTTEPDNESSRVVTGRVLRVDAQEGTIVIQTPVGIIALRGPKEDLREVSVGDIVEVEMVDGGHPSASPRLDDDEQ